METSLGCTSTTSSFDGTPDYDATGTFEATEVIVSAEAAGKLLQLEVEEGTRLKAGEEVGLVDTVQLYLKKLQLEASMKSVESQRPDLAKQIAATKQQITTAQREKKRVENLLAAGAANQKQLDDWDAQVTLLQRQLIAQESSLMKSTNSLTEQGNSVSIQVAQVEDQLNKCHIQSPIEGTVLAKYVYFANRIIAYCAFSMLNPSVSARQCHIPARQPVLRPPDTAAIPAAISRKDWIRCRSSYIHRAAGQRLPAWCNRRG